jgi:PAS domain S-box-containing protein
MNTATSLKKEMEHNSLIFEYSIINLIINKDEFIVQAFPAELNNRLPEKSKLKNLFSNNLYSNYFKENLKIVRSKNILREFQFEITQRDITQHFRVSITPLNHFKSSVESFSIQISKLSKDDFNENNYKHIFESAILGIYQFDFLKNEFLSVNPELARILGFENTHELLSEQDRLQLLNINSPNRSKVLKLLEDSDEIHGYETELLINGTKVWISENIRVIRKNGIIQQLIGSLKDVSERKMLVERLQSTKDDWQRTFNAIEEVIIILDKDLKITRLNKAALKEYDTFTDNPEGVFCTNLYNIGESHCNTCPARATILDLKPHAREVEYQSLGKTFLTSSLPIFDDANEFMGVVFIAKNITEKKKFKMESEKLLQQVILADRLKSLGELVANVAHEINNPNNFVVQNISLLERSWKLFQPIIDDYITENSQDEYNQSYYKDLSEEMGELIDSIKVGSKRISNVVSNLKGFAKADVDNYELISINEVIESGLKIIQSKINSSFNNFVLCLDPKLPKVRGDFHKLEQVFINLIVNSVQARKNEFNTGLRIKTKIIDRLNAIYIEIFDNGHGIPNKIIPKLFDPFFTTRREEGGTGLGLSISYEIIEKHNGIMDVHSITNIGTIFKIYIPIENKSLAILNSRMLCIDSDNSIFNEEIVCFLGEGKQTMVRKQNTKQLCQYLEIHPEIDVLLINAKIVENIIDFTNELLKINPLFEIVLFKIDSHSAKSLERNGIKIVDAIDEKEIIIEINKILNSLSR